MRFVPTANTLLNLVECCLLQLVHLIKSRAVYFQSPKAVEILIIIEALSHKDKLAAIVECYHVGISIPTSDVSIKTIAKQASK